MPRTREEILKELDAIAEQAKRDAELARTYFEVSKAFHELQKRLAGNKEKTSNTALFHYDTAKRVGTIKDEVIKYLKSLNGQYVKSDEIREAVRPLFPDKTDGQIFNRVRDILSEGDIEIARKPGKGRGMLYGAK